MMGEIVVLNKMGENIGKVPIPEYPEIVGMHFSKQKQDIMYVTENSNQPTCLRVLIDDAGYEKSVKENRINNYGGTS